ncbi:LysR family transcriptional regulator [Sediminibacillus halophilus]|uniref:DNA-binding transcriptional regulator, LysR family n=1 Tax=Sediminibacillus halophilus TaxID=482461 RepID=A0A1G9NC99_9BACI|nr:LysR family transcriptional regulator [Sediminibacillus halophilus]SDL84110.1 DNA-binding transcriptional regulator, LysR family [Sediminibacillus halophilus]
MQYDALQTFLTAAETKNFTKTAELLHISQPSVSLHIKNLEKEFETELFVRSPKQFHITPTGEMLYYRGKQIIQIYEQTKQEILAHHHAVQGELRIGASFTIGEYILPAVLVDLQKHYPNLQLKITIGNTEEIIGSVRELNVDAGLIEGQTSDQDLIVEPFTEDQLFIVAASSHHLNSLGKVTIDDLQNQIWITREEGSGTRAYLEHVLRSLGIKVKAQHSISSSQGIKEFITEGIGISLLSESVIQRDVIQKDLSIIELKDHSFKRTLSCIYSPIMLQKQNVQTFRAELMKRC